MRETRSNAGCLHHRLRVLQALKRTPPGHFDLTLHQTNLYSIQQKQTNT